MKKLTIILLALLTGAQLFAQEEWEIFTVVEESPQFHYKGINDDSGQAIRQYLKDHMAAPPTGCVGKFYVTLVVQSDSTVADVRMLREASNCGDYGDQLIVAVRNMPKWIPGKQRGKAVRVQYNFPFDYNAPVETEKTDGKNSKKNKRR